VIFAHVFGTLKEPGKENPASVPRFAVGRTLAARKTVSVVVAGQAAL